MTELDISILEAQRENLPCMNWVRNFVMLDADDPAPSLTSCNFAAQKEVIRRGLWSYLGHCETLADEIPGKDTAMLHCNNQAFKANPVASAILGKPVFGRVALFKVKSEAEYDSLAMHEYETLFPEHLPSLDDLDKVKSGRKRSEIIAEFEAKEEFGQIIERVQFMRNKEGSNCSAVQIVRQVTKEAFEQLILPQMKLSDPTYWADLDWDEYQRVYQRLGSLYVATLNESLGQFDLFHLTNVTDVPYTAAYRLKVPSLDCPEAKLWAKIADSDVSRKRAIELQRQMAKRLKMDQPLALFQDE